jgi:hypothetical protein
MRWRNELQNECCPVALFQLPTVSAGTSVACTAEDGRRAEVFYGTMIPVSA